VIFIKMLSACVFEHTISYKLSAGSECSISAELYSMVYTEINENRLKWPDPNDL